MPSPFSKVKNIFSGNNGDNNAVQNPQVDNNDPSVIMGESNSSAVPQSLPPEPVNQQPDQVNKTTEETPSVGASPGPYPDSQSPNDSQPLTANPKPKSQLDIQASGAIDQDKRKGMDVLTRLTARSNKTMMAAVAKAKELNIQFIDTEYVLWGLLSDAVIYQLLSDLKVTPGKIQADIEAVFKKGDFKESPQFSPRVKRALELSLSVARSLGYEFISPEHILLALAQEGEGQAAQILVKNGLTVNVLSKKITGKEKSEKKEEEIKKTSNLENYTQDLTLQAKNGKLDPVVGRSTEVERLMHILSRRSKNNPILIGEPGVGKTAIVEGLAQRIVAGNVPETLKNKRVLSLDLMSIIAGSSQRGELEQRLKNLVREIKSAGNQIILFIDEIHNIVGGGGGSVGSAAANILKPSLARGELQTIGATTITEYRKYMEKDRAFERRFQPILVEEPSPQQAIQMVIALRDKYEAYHKVSIPDEAVKTAVQLSHRYIGDRFLPDKAIDLIDEAASSVRLPAISLPEQIQDLTQSRKRLEEEIAEAKKISDDVRVSSLHRQLEALSKELEEKKKEFEFKKSTTTNQVNPESIKEIVSHWTNIPISKLTESESGKLLNLEDLLHQRLIDQQHAVDAVAEAVRRGRAGLKSTKRPIGSFIFLGPTGTGKTELAKALAEILFGSEEKLVRLDMTEYMEKHEVAKLIGAPPGYVGYEEGGQLTEAVRRQPYSVVLLDEVEKAHADVFNILLQILDDGRLTDNKGRTIDFKNTILIATSNIGTNLIQEEMLTDKPFVFKTKKISTLTYSPTKRILLTLNSRMWQKEDQAQSWTTLPAIDYFKGQELEGADILQLKQKFPAAGFDTHTIVPSGEEIITVGGRLWKRKSTTAKVWQTLSLIEYFNNQEVTNAAPDRPDEQLPTVKMSTFAVSPSEAQIVTYQDRCWKRENLNANKWVTCSLKDYIADALVQEEKADKGTDLEKKPETKTQPNDTVNPQTAAAEMPKENNPPVSSVPGSVEANADLQKQVQELMGSDAKTLKTKPVETQEPASSQPSASPLSSLSPSVQIPIDSWDIHLFIPSGGEIIIKGTRYWKKEKPEEKVWTTGLLFQLFPITAVANADGADPEQQLPVGQEIDKVRKVKEAADDLKFAKLKEKLIEQLREFFRPELLNRFDDILVFKPLDPDDLLKIVDLQFKSMVKLLEEQNIGLEFTEATKQEIAIEGYDPVFGARPLRRTIQKMIENPISSMIIRGDLKQGDIVLVDFDGNDFVFTAKIHPANIKSKTNEEVSTDQADKKEPLEEAKEGLTEPDKSAELDKSAEPTAPVTDGSGEAKVEEKKPEEKIQKPAEESLSEVPDQQNQQPPVSSQIPVPPPPDKIEAVEPQSAMPKTPWS